MPGEVRKIRAIFSQPKKYDLWVIPEYEYPGERQDMHGSEMYQIADLRYQTGISYMAQMEYSARINR